MFQHILMPTDGSEASLRAVQTGARLAKALGASATIMIAVEQFSAAVHGAAAIADDNPLRKAASDAARHWLTQSIAAAAREGVKAEECISDGATVYQAILQAAKTSGADLIVMGTHGAGALERLLMGSQTQRVLAHTTIPVLVVR